MKSSTASDTDLSLPVESNQLLGKTILLVNTGSLAKRFTLYRMKELGIRIIALNLEKNWADECVEHWILSDTFNHDECVRKIRAFLHAHPDRPINGAITFWEDDVPLLSKLCETFHWKGNGNDVALRTRSKFDMQETLRQCGRPYIPQYLLKHASDVETAIASIGFPAVIKPRCGSDSQYVVYVKNEEEAHAAYKYVKKNCTPAYDPIYHYNNYEFVYQKYIPGQEFSVECYIQNGVPRVVGVHQKTAMTLPFFMETGDFCPSRCSPEEEQSLKDEAVASLVAIKVQNSLSHVELKMTPAGPQVIEIASRMGGEYVYQNVRQVYDFDLIKAGCEIACGLPVTDIPTDPNKCVLARFFIPSQSGVIHEIVGLDELENNRYVIDYTLSKRVGATISVPPQGFESAGWVLVGANSHQEAEERMASVLERVNITVTPQNQHSAAEFGAEIETFPQ